MCGFGLKTGFSFTPKATGTLYVWITGFTNNSVAGSGNTIRGAFGTGTAPSPNAVATGTNFGLPKRFVQGATGPVVAPDVGFTVMGRIPGLTLNTAVWFDLAILGVTSGIATVQDVDCVIMEDY
jgi:hypothetical protein